MISDSAFIAATDDTLDAIEQALDAADGDLDWTRNDGILEVDAGNGTLVINRHLPQREIWVAARRGGFHFRPVDGRWRDARGDAELGVLLAQLLRDEAGATVDFGVLPTP